ncbi:Pick1 [Columba livia]|nr:Pick1 [Columba livia]
MALLAECPDPDGPAEPAGQQNSPALPTAPAPAPVLPEAQLSPVPSSPYSPRRLHSIRGPLATNVDLPPGVPSPTGQSQNSGEGRDLAALSPRLTCQIIQEVWNKQFQVNRLHLTKAMFADLDYDIEEDKLGIPTVPGTVTLKKDSQNLIGISIGGGAQYCPCLYIVQGEVTIHYNKLQADPKQGKSLDIVLKKVKHRLVENMSSGTADALGLSRAILCNDGLVKRLEELERTAELYKGLTEHTKSLLRAFFELSQTHRAFGDVFSVIGVREPQPAASEAFIKFADAHRNIEKFGIHLLKTIKPSYCLKVKEMDDEEYSCIALNEPLYRVSTGNYEYRLILRCRQEARTRFAKMRKDVLEKIELLDQKHVQDIVFQLQRFVSTMSKYYDDCYAVLRDADVFPIEVDLARTTLNYGQDTYMDGAEEEGGSEREGSGKEDANGEKLIDDA